MKHYVRKVFQNVQEAIGVNMYKIHGIAAEAFPTATASAMTQIEPNAKNHASSLEEVRQICNRCQEEKVDEKIRRIITTTMTMRNREGGPFNKNTAVAAKNN
jgi:hypothetical protein